MSWPAPVLGAVAIVLSTIAASPAVASVPLTIAAVQGTGSSTPMAGDVVTVQGVLTAELPSFGGFFVQSAESADVVGASDGIFVKSARASFDVGDLISVTGVAGESKGQTQIAARSVSLVTPSFGIPDAASLPDTVLGGDREAFEGMLVDPVGMYYLDSVRAKHGALELSAGTTSSTSASRILLDDGIDRRVTTQPFLQPDSVIRPGDTLVAPRRPMVLGQAAGEYRLEPSVPITRSSDQSYKPKFQASSPRLGSAPRVTP